MSRSVRVKEAAQIVGLSVSQMNKMRLTGDGPEFLKLGARVLYEVSALEVWVASKRRRSTSDVGNAA